MKVKSRNPVVNKAKSKFFDMINKVDKLLACIIKKKEIKHK